MTHFHWVSLVVVGLCSVNFAAPTIPDSPPVPESPSIVEARRDAGKGDIDAMFKLAAAYARGNQVKRDLNAATEWYTKGLSTDPPPDNGWCVLPFGGLGPSGKAYDEARAALTKAGIDELKVRASAFTLRKFVFKNDKLDEVLDMFGQDMEMNLAVNWRALEAAGIHRDALISQNLQKITYGEAVSAILNQAGKDKVRWAVIGGVVVISTPDDLTRQRGVFEHYQASMIAAKDPRDVAVFAALLRDLPLAKFSETELGDALDFLRDLTGVRFTVNWKALEKEGVTRHAPISADLQELPASRILQIVLAETGSSAPLILRVENGTMAITASPELAKAKPFGN